MHNIIKSPAKVNLFLRVIRKRGDGYHDISTLMQPISLYDEIELNVEDGSAIIVDSDSPEAPGGESNIVYKAVSAFFGKTGAVKKVSINIRKKIPVGAGLGGGSSNAASVLMALNEMSRGCLSTKDLSEIALKCGSDAPFFLLKSTCYAEGRGEVLSPLELPECHYVLVNPGIHVSTKWAYDNLTLTKIAEDNILNSLKARLKGIKDLALLLGNDLEAVTAKKHPEIVFWKNRLMESGAIASLMSGSGSTVFGLFDSEGAATEAAEIIKKDLSPGVRVYCARGL